MKKLKFVISAVIIFALISGMIPTIFAINQAENDFIPSKIVREINEKREESSKTFLCEDGTYLAVTYSEPVHYKDAGVWKEVDNSLILDAKKNYSPRSSGYSIYLPESMSADKKIIAQNGDSTLSFSIDLGAYLNSSMNKAKRVPVENLASNAIYKNDEKNDINYNENEKTTEVEEYNNKLTEVKNQKNALVYNDLFPGVDFEYVVSSGSLKENIVINQPQDKYMYSFSVDFSGLTPVTNPDGSISLMRDKEAVFVLSAPYMYDMNRAESVDVKMFLKENNDNYILTISADREWINSKERAFPVIIDPTINIATNEISDVFVENLMFANSPRSNDELRVGKNLTNLTRTYIKTTLPTTIPYGSVINSANLTLYKDYYFQAWNQSDINVVACDCSSRSTWQADSVSWNNQPFSNAVNGYQNVSGCQIASVAVTESKTTYIFNVKTAAQKWLNTGTNKGIMLASSNENSKTQVDFHSTRVNDSSNRPKMVISYTTSGVGPLYWSPSANACNTTVNVVCNTSWTIISNQEWLTYVNKGANSFTAKVTRNPSTNTRTGMFQIISGSTIIGTVTVTQPGSDPVFIIGDTSDIMSDSSSYYKDITLTSNTSWEVSSCPNWITISPSMGTSSETVRISLNENTTFDDREGTIVFTGHGINRQINVIQIGKISQMFVNKSTDLFYNHSSSDYNHQLATWCMDISFAAYNNPNNQALPPVPGLFMGGHNEPATTVLENYGFDDVLPFNYGPNQTGAHVIGHKDVFLANENGSLIEKELVVVDIRGTVTMREWFEDFVTEFNASNNQFEVMSQAVIASIDSYLVSHNISENEAYFVITGHSLGAAIANLVAANMNGATECPRIYTYTFATPNTVNEAVAGNEAIGFSNIFNILNSNDVVTYVPFTLTPNINNWKRHGIDLYIDMPWTEQTHTEPIGLISHMMSTYFNWMTSYDELSLATIEQLSAEATIRGLLPKIVSVKCPVSVSILDDMNNIIAFESQQNDLTYPETSDTGIVSWITDTNEKIFFVPSWNENIKVKIEAYDYGSMRASFVALESADIFEGKTYNNVNLFPGKEFSVEISNETSIEEVRLYVTENDEIVGEVTETNPPFKGITANFTDIDYGVPLYLTITTDLTVTEINLYNRSTSQTMHLVPNGIYVVSVVTNGEDKIWTIGFYPSTGTSIFDISVKSGDEWFNYDNIIEIRCT